MLHGTKVRKGQPKVTQCHPRSRRTVPCCWVKRALGWVGWGWGGGGVDSPLQGPYLHLYPLELPFQRGRCPLKDEIDPRWQINDTTQTNFSWNCLWRFPGSDLLGTLICPVWLIRMIRSGAGPGCDPPPQQTTWWTINEPFHYILNTLRSWLTFKASLMNILYCRCTSPSKGPTIRILVAGDFWK